MSRKLMADPSAAPSIPEKVRTIASKEVHSLEMQREVFRADTISEDIGRKCVPLYVSRFSLPQLGS